MKTPLFIFVFVLFDQTVETPRKTADILNKGVWRFINKQDRYDPFYKAPSVWKGYIEADICTLPHTSDSCDLMSLFDFYGGGGGGGGVLKAYTIML